MILLENVIDLQNIKHIQIEIWPSNYISKVIILK